ncbi:MAG: nitroreductase family protein [Acidimicrobiia bacterium]
MAELTDIMRTTFACRAFTDEALPDSELAAILDVARFAPSGGNRQGWHAIVIREQATKDRLIELSTPAIKLYVAQRDAGENPWNTIDASSVDPATVDVPDREVRWYTNLAKAPVFVLVAVDLKVVASADKELDRIGVISGASVYPFAHNILLAARDRGWGGALTTLVAAAEPEIQALLGMPSHVAVAALLPMGRPRQLLTKLTRKPVSEISHLERWDGPALQA